MPIVSYTHLTCDVYVDTVISQIRVNAVNPTVVMTDMGKLGWSDPKKAGPMLDRIPMKQFAGKFVCGIIMINCTILGESGYCIASSCLTTAV